MAAPTTTFGDLKKQVAAYMHRAVGDFTVDSVDILTKAVYRARTNAQLRHNFEALRCAISIPNVSITAGALLSTAVLDGTVTAVDVKTIECAFITVGSVQLPIDTISKAHHRMTLKQSYAALGSVSDLTAYAPASVGSYSLVRQGDRIFVTPADSTFLGGTPFTLKADAVQWADTYASDSVGDFFTNQGEQFVIFRTVYELNYFLKEEERVQLSVPLMQDAWDALIAWDTSLVKMVTDDSNLK